MHPDRPGFRLCCGPVGAVACCCLTQAAYKDYVTAIILRKNTVTKVLYRDDPNILAWDLINEPAFPGDESGDGLHVRGPCCTPFIALLAADGNGDRFIGTRQSTMTHF